MVLIGSAAVNSCGRGSALHRAVADDGRHRVDGLLDLGQPVPGLRSPDSVEVIAGAEKVGTVRPLLCPVTA